MMIYATVNFRVQSLLSSDFAGPIPWWELSELGNRDRDHLK